MSINKKTFMIELEGEIIYKVEVEEILYNHYVNKKMKTVTTGCNIRFPNERGISVLDDGKLILTNKYLAEKTLKEIFFDIDVKIHFSEIYYYELEKDILESIHFKVESEKEVKRFLRKKKIAMMLYEA